MSQPQKSGADLLAPEHRKVGVPASAIMWLLVAFGVAFLGIVFTGSAVAGPTLMGFACLLGITARILQAGYYQNHPPR